MSDSSVDELLEIAALSEDIVHATPNSEARSQATSRERNTDIRGHEITESVQSEKRSTSDQRELDRENLRYLFSLKNAYSVIVNNLSSTTQDLGDYYDRKIQELKTFLEQIANFSTVKVFQNRIGVKFQRIFQDVIQDPQLENYDSLLCFVICNHNSRKFFRSKTPGSDYFEGVVPSIIKCPRLNKKPKLFFIQEITANKKLKKGYQCPDIDGGNEFLLVHEKSGLSDKGLIPGLLKLFREFADQENILSMLARCSYSTIHAQVQNLSKPIVFDNCYGKPKHVEQKDI